MRPAYFILYGFADRNKETKEATKSRVKITLIVKQAEFTTDSIANEKKQTRIPLQYTPAGKELKTILSTHQDSCSLDLSNTRKFVDPNFSIQLTKNHTPIS